MNIVSVVWVKLKLRTQALIFFHCAIPVPPRGWSNDANTNTHTHTLTAHCSLHLYHRSSLRTRSLSWLEADCLLSFCRLSLTLGEA